MKKTRRGGRRKGAGRKLITSRIRPFPFGSPPTAPGPVSEECSPQGVHCRSRINPRHNYIFAVYCDSWSCPRCAVKLTEKWQRHITRVTLHEDDKGQVWNSAFVFMTSHSEWISSVRKYLRRHRAHYVRIKLRGQEVAVINNGKFGAILGSSWSNSEISERAYGFGAGLNEIFAAMDPEARPISASKEWQLKNHSTDYGSQSHLKLVHFLGGEAFQGVRPKLEGWGIPVREHYGEGKTSLEFDWPDSLSQTVIAIRECMLADYTQENSISLC